MTNSYRVEALRTARIAFSYWQREPASPSFGCFDRQYWGWKKKDLADATLQAAVTLCVRLAEAEGTTATLPPFLIGYVDYLERIQHRDGSFDQVYPFERTPGVVHDLLTPLIWLLRSPHIDLPTRNRLETIIHKGAAFALRTDETHGEIANHFAGYAWELIHYGKTFAHADAEEYGQRYLDRTLALFNESEGWFREYDGADAGYQTRLLSFLARIAALRDDEELWGICEKGARFVEALLMPDNSLHPMLGVRSTALIYPSAFERLAARNPSFDALADRIHDGWLTGSTPRPSDIDFENGIRIAEDAFEASAIRDRRAKVDKPLSAAKAVEFSSYDLPNAGINRCIFGLNGRRHVLTVGSKLGGVVILHKHHEAQSYNLALEDSGYLLHLSDDTRWIVRRADAGAVHDSHERVIHIEAHFSRSLHEDLHSLQLIILRILNLTVLRSQWIGDLFRRIVVTRLISGHKILPLRLDRRISVDSKQVEIVDRLIACENFHSRLQGARLYRCRRTIANHMASSRYFQPAELAPAGPWLEPLPLDVLDGREIRRVVRVGE